MCALATESNSITKTRTTTTEDAKNDKNNTNYRWLAVSGDIAHILSMTSTLVFCGLVVTRIHLPPASETTTRTADSPTDALFDPQWKQDGFCVSHPTTPYWTSHDVCLYVDVLAFLVVGAVYLWLRNHYNNNNGSMTIANELLKAGLPGLIGHGIGHGALAAAMRAKSEQFLEAAMATANETFGTTAMDNRDLLATTTPTTTTLSTSWEFFQEQPLTDSIQQSMALILFWMGLLSSVMPKASWTSIFVLMAPILVAQLFIPAHLGFTYVQTVLMILFSLNECVMRPRSEKIKEPSYALYAWMVSVPVTLVGWLESTQCSTSFVKDSLYGHVVYDASIPITMLVFYLTCYGIAATKSTTTATTIVSNDKKTL